LVELYLFSGVLYQSRDSGSQEWKIVSNEEINVAFSPKTTRTKCPKCPIMCRVRCRILLNSTRLHQVQDVMQHTPYTESSKK